MELFSAHRLLALPIVDDDHVLKGMIDVQLYMEESVGTVDNRHQTDVFQILGLSLEMGKKKSPWKSYRIRMPWIICNMAGGLACAIISFAYEAVLQKMILLAMFIPLILTLTESISMQSMTQSLHLVRLPNITLRRIFHRIFVEGKMVIFLALTCAVVIGFISLLWKVGIVASAIIAVSLFFSISISASVGASIPLILHSKSLDPKVASGPVVLMFTDVLTTTIYLSLASWWLL
jgi:magnesium transporter